ncbi:hypothetical protein H6S82_05130 [Planktothrix sp. FACHB-1355]|uniref:Uncharacterized protein n=1 Tax=Aerosakkonema funiforme FACHB-1375 TaxID=2949571 RepID=A0A926VLV7_9CYAN|nr:MULTISPECIES: hypothetical protein [Oscillatoriales]MBD2186109.1 hypothetical protein [Aerosakkonema funiforme FACHB-1375]MBD3558238.1 hypothetical protein [Planktothrix sp. FACHB-1355]
MPRKRYKEISLRCQYLPDSDEALLFSYLQNHPFFSFKEMILPLVRARWLLAAYRNAETHSKEQLEYLRRECINFFIRQIDEVCHDAGFDCAELGAIAPGVYSGLVPFKGMPQAVAESVSCVSPTVPSSFERFDKPDELAVKSVESYQLNKPDVELQSTEFNLANFDPAMLGPTFS